MPGFSARGPCSWFGGPNDTGVSPSEGLAFIYDYDDRPDLFLKSQPAGTTGLARRLNPEIYYVACRWDYDATPKDMLADKRYVARVSVGDRSFIAWPADWGPHESTGRVADLSPALMEALNIETDDVVDIKYPIEQEAQHMRIAMSSGHCKKVQGAVGIINEVDEARKVVNRVAEILNGGGQSCVTFHDDLSTTQSENLQRIVSWHNEQTRDYDVSMHFNAYQPTDAPMGTETLYVTQSGLAAQMAGAMAASGGFVNRGAKKRGDLYFLNQTAKPSILIEVCFVDSATDCGLYEGNFEEICQSIAITLAPDLAAPGEPPTRPPPQALKVVDVQIYAPKGVRVDVSINEEASG